MRSPGAAHAIEAAVNSADRREPEASVRISAEFALLRLCEASHNRKNWLFVGSQQAGERAAVVLSLIESAKLNGYDPWAYFKDVFERLPTLKQRDLAQLLPHNWRPASDTAAPTTTLTTVVA